MPVNVVEAALRVCPPSPKKPNKDTNYVSGKGVMECHEPCAPLHFLLSPKFLSTDRARVASFAVSKCIPHMQSKQLTEALRLALTSTRRKLLKVNIPLLFFSSFLFHSLFRSLYLFSARVSGITDNNTLPCRLQRTRRLFDCWLPALFSLTSK